MRCACLLSICSSLAFISSEAQPTQTTIGSHPCLVWNATGSPIVVIYHGLDNPVSGYNHMAESFASLGYAAVVPQDCAHDTGLICAPVWGKNVAAAVNAWGNGRPIAIVGHSMGGGAAMAAAKFTPGLAAYVAMHPAPVLSGPPTRIHGPILFTTGTLDDGSFGGGAIGATSQLRAQGSYVTALSPRALINVVGNAHMAPLSADGPEWWVAVRWIDCYARKTSTSCAWLADEMCKSLNTQLKWCFYDNATAAEFVAPRDDDVTETVKTISHDVQEVVNLIVS